MSDPTITVVFDQPSREYAPRMPMSAHYAMTGVIENLRAVEQSVLWYTEGKGEEDLGVHFFQRLAGSELLKTDVIHGVVTVVLPASPLSYEGLIVKIRWCVRVRLFFAGGRDFVSEHVFDVGHVPPARLPGEGRT